MKITKSHDENLPYELQIPARFFPVIVDKDGKKIPLGKDWCNPKNQISATTAAITQYAGFDISGHDIRDDYALLDFDHVLDETTGVFVNADAEKWFNFIQGSFDGYAELSVSGTGIHIFLKPTKSKFGKITNSKGKGVLYFDEPNNIKLEIFYKNAARYCLVTGEPFRCEKCAPIASGEIADEILNTLLAAICPSSSSAETIKQPARADLPNADAPEYDLFRAERMLDVPNADAPEYDLFRAERMLDVIRPAELGDSDWLAVQSAAKNIGVSYAVLDAFNRRDEKRYSSEENQSRYDSLKDASFDIRTLHGIAKRFGYDEKDSQREWYKLHPNTNPAFDDPEVEAAFCNRVTELAAESEFDAEIKKRLDEWQKQNGKIQPKTLDELKQAVSKLNALTPENFTAADAHNNKHNAALALAFELYDEAEKFFVTIKAAKENAKNRMKEADKLTAPLTQDELVSLSALVEGVDVKLLRNHVAREAGSISRTHAVLWRAQLGEIEAEKEEQEYQKRREAAIAAEKQKKSRLQQLKEMEPSEERDAEIISLIRDCCEWCKDRHGDPYAIRATQANIDLILNYDPDLDGLFGFDEFQQADVFLKPAPWGKKCRGDEWADRDDAQLRVLIRGRYAEFANKELIADNITKFSEARAFHEVKEFFEALPTWDGEPRAETLFVKYLKADNTPYTREVTLNWLTAAVARIFHPGCDYQLAPILLGDQGIGKSFITQNIFGKWHGTLSDAVDDPHAIDAIQKMWCVEVKEMAAMKKDVDANKRFIDTAEDTRRFAYDRRARKVKRHCVFIITSNNQQLLSDLTGNRRYPIIVCNAKRQDAKKPIDADYVKQLWAEVYAHYKELFKDGFDEKKLVLSDAAKKLVDEIADQHLNDDGMTGEVKAFLDMKILPPVIWDLLGKEERRQYFVDGGIFEIEEMELAARFKASRKNIPPELQAAFDDAIAPCDFVHRYHSRDKKSGEISTFFKFIGNEYRQHICAAEIKNERFDKSNRRATSQVISDILAHVEGWTLGKRIQKAPVYGDQRKVYYRNADNIPDEEPPAFPPAPPPGNQPAPAPTPAPPA